MRASHGDSCGCTASRRGFLGAAAALAASAAPLRLSAAPAPRRCIDVHSHVVPPSYVEVLKAGGALSAGYAGWTPDKAIETMDRLGIATSILSIPNPTKFPIGIETNRTLARTVNEYAARVQQDHPQRFGSFAYLPLDDVDGSLKELTYALDVLRADGVFCWTSYGAKWFGDPAFAPVYEELSRRKAVV